MTPEKAALLKGHIAKGAAIAVTRFPSLQAKGVAFLAGVAAQVAVDMVLVKVVSAATEEKFAGWIRTIEAKAP